MSLALQAEQIVKSRTAKVFSGVSAQFVFISSEWGYKYFSSAHKRDEAYQNQLTAYEAGCAPQVGEKVDVQADFGWGVQIRYGYITEAIVYTYTDLYPNLEYTDYRELKGEFTRNPKKHVTLRLLHERLEAANLPTNDLHGSNCGWLANGDFVMIDFGYDA